MAFLIDEAFLPATLTAPPMTDEEFASFCAEHPDLSFETTSEGELIVMPLTYSLSGARNSEISAQLHIWARRDKRGVACDSSTGFRLPNGARRSPDASWVLKTRVQLLDERSRQRYWRLSPDFVIELRSQTDRPRMLREKMREWIENGAQLGWMIDPENRQVDIYRPNLEEIETLQGVTSIQGTGPVEGFVLDLLPVWDPME